MNTILAKVSDDDAKVLAESIFELNALKEIFDKTKTETCTEEYVKASLESYMTALKNHKLIWSQMLVKYVGEDDASKLYNLLKYDLHKKVIFKMNIKGCALCSM